jgi:hypothetical protein
MIDEWWFFVIKQKTPLGFRPRRAYDYTSLPDFWIVIEPSSRTSHLKINRTYMLPLLE